MSDRGSGNPVTSAGHVTPRRHHGLAAMVLGCAGLAATAARPDPGAARADDAFGFLAPTVTIAADERARLARGEITVRVLPARDRDVAILAVARIAATPDRLIDWIRHIDQLKRSALVPAIARFSDPPVAADLAALSLDDGDVDALRRCRPGDCAVKLTAPEIQEVQRAIGPAGGDWRNAAQLAFKRVVLARVERFRAEGARAIGPFADHAAAIAPHDELRGILGESPYLHARLPALAAFLAGSAKRPPGTETFFYWSKEQVGSKSTVNVTEVTIARGEGGDVPLVLVAGRQVFASHYMTGSLGLTALVGGGASDPRYLVYLNRTRVDVLGGWFSGVIRLLIERRVREDAVGVLRGLRERIESGEPAPGRG